MAARTPTKVLQLRGGFDRHPERLRKRALEPPVAGSLGDPPDYFTPPQAAVWAEMNALLPAGVAGRSDRPAMEMLAVLLCEFRASQTEMKPQLLVRLDSLFSRFGFTPSDRSRVVANRPNLADHELELARALRELGDIPDA